MKGFHHPGGSQQAFLTGLAHLYNLVPYQRRAQHAGQCGVGWKADEYPPQTGCSTCKSSPQAAFDEWGHTPPLNSVECGPCNDSRSTTTVPHGCARAASRLCRTVSGVSTLAISSVSMASIGTSAS